MAPTTSTNRRPCSERHTPRITCKIRKGSCQLGVQNSNTYRIRNRPEKLDRLRKCRAMLKSDRDGLQTKENLNFKLNKNVLDIERDANLQNAVQHVNELLEDRVRLQTDYNVVNKNTFFENEIIEESIDIRNFEDNLIVNRQEIRHFVSQQNEMTLPNFNTAHGRVDLNKRSTVQPIDLVEKNLATNGNSPNVMKIKLPGSNSYRQLHCIGSDNFQRNFASAVKNGNREDPLSLPTHIIHGESILGIAVIEPKACNGTEPMEEATRILNKTIDLEDSSSDSDVLQSDVRDQKISKSEEKDHRRNKFLEKSDEINLESDAQAIASKAPNVRVSKLQCTGHCDEQSRRHMNDSVGVRGKISNMTPVKNNDCHTLKKVKRPKSLDVNGDNIKEKNSKTVCLQDYLETPFLCFCKEGLISRERSSSFSRKNVGKANEEVLCKQFDSRTPKSLKSLEKTKLVDGMEVSIGKTCSLPLSCTCPGCQFSPGRGTAISDPTSGCCVDGSVGSRSLNERFALSMDQSSTDVDKNENCVGENFALSINLGNLIEAKRKRACCHLSDASTCEHQTSQTPVYDRTNKNAVAKKSEPKNVVESLLSCRSCSFRAISGTILVQHTQMHEQLLAAGCTDTKDISTEAEQITMQTLRVERTVKLMATKKKRSYSRAHLLANLIQGQVKTQVTRPVIADNNIGSHVQTRDVQANPSLPIVILETPEDESKVSNASVMAYALQKDSKMRLDHSDAPSTQPKYHCKYCNFSCVKQQKYANHMRFCDSSMKSRLGRKAQRPSYGTIKALCSALEDEPSPTQDRSKLNKDRRMMSIGNENPPITIQQEPDLDAVFSQYANTTGSTSSDAQNLASNLPTKKLAFTMVPGACREVLQKCTVCDFTTVVMASLVRHVKHHRHQNELDTLRCAMCAYETTDTAEMSLHFSQSCVHDSTYSGERLGMGELDGVEGELKNFHLRNTMDFAGEAAAPLDPINADVTGAIWTTESIRAKELVTNSFTEVGASDNLQKNKFPPPNVYNISNNDAVAHSLINGFDDGPLHHRHTSDSSVTNTMRMIYCSKH